MLIRDEVCDDRDDFLIHRFASVYLSICSVCSILFFAILMP